MASEITLEGYDHIIKQIKAMGLNLDKVEGKAVIAGAEVLQGAISSRAEPRSAQPRAPNNSSQAWRTGEHLLDNIIITQIQLDERGRYCEVGPTPGDNSPFFYGKFFEWGTSKMPARPFVEPSFRESRKAIEEAIIEALKGGLNL